MKMMLLKNSLEKDIRLLSEAYVGRDSKSVSPIFLNIKSPWNIKLHLSGEYKIRNLKKNDLKTLMTFGEYLGPMSKELFCPYPWDDGKNFSKSIKEAINKSLDGIDASFVLFHDNLPIGHFFLWKVQENEYSQRFDVHVPELGVAIADKYQGKGLGKYAVELLKIIAEHSGADGIELTTAISNKGGFSLYRKCGFEYVGDIKNPLEVDVTEVFEKQAEVRKYRRERQMVSVINKNKKEKIFTYLSNKRQEAERM